MKRITASHLRGPALASMLLMASAQTASPSLSPADRQGLDALDTPHRDIVCLVDSGYGDQSPVLCFSKMTPRELATAHERDGRGYLGLPFHAVEAVPLVPAAVSEVYDIRDDRLPLRKQWAFGVCWARIDEWKSRGERVPSPPCYK